MSERGRQTIKQTDNQTETEKHTPVICATLASNRLIRRKPLQRQNSQFRGQGLLSCFHLPRGPAPAVARQNFLLIGFPPGCHNLQLWLASRRKREASGIRYVCGGGREGLCCAGALKRSAGVGQAAVLLKLFVVWVLLVGRCVYVVYKSAFVKFQD